MLKSLKINDWKHIEAIELEFDKPVVILTGSNGSGKSTIMRLLSQHADWNLQEYGTPDKDQKTGLISYFSRLLPSSWFGGQKKTEFELGFEIGEIKYLNGVKAPISVTNNKNSAGYNVSISGRQNIRAIHIPAYRPLFVHQPVNNISTTPTTKQNAFSTATLACRNNYLGNSNQAGYFLKDTLLNWIHHGYGNALSPGNQLYLDLFDEFQTKLASVLPESLGFEKIEPRNSDVILKCKSGEYLLDASSGGITALIDLTWQIFLANDGTPFLVLIDEIENHLHPSLQRSVLANLSNAYPNARFICTTHSPFVVSSVADSSVYALKFNERNRVVSQKLDLSDKSGSAAEVLREILGVPVTVPIWVEEKINHLVKKYQDQDLTPEKVKIFSQELKDAGLENLSVLALASLASGK
ncbi:MAG: AAA family ATPase [Pseudobdellovibrionaceae bacterium]